MKKLITPYFIIFLLICDIGVLKTQAQSKYEDPNIERLNQTYQFDKSIQVARFKFLKANSNEEKLFYNNCIIRGYSNMGNNDSALTYLKYSKDFLPNVKDSELICYTYLRFGLVYGDILDINNSINYHLKAAMLAQKINYTYIIVRAYYSLANEIGDENGNLKLALYYSNLAIKYTDDKNFDFKKPLFINSKIYALINRASILVKLGKIKESLNDLFYAEKLSNNISEEKEHLLKNLYMCFSLTYAMINDKINSEKYINEAIKISLLINDKESLNECNRIIANNSFLFKDYYKAIFYGVKAENYENKNNVNLGGKIYIDSIIYLSYRNIGDHENALKYFEKFVSLKNKYYEKSKINELNKLDIKFKLEENEKKLAVNKLTETQNKATIQFLVMFILITIILILVVLGYKHLENIRKKLIFSAISNSDNEINSTKTWLEWRNNSKKLENSNLSDLHSVIENDSNSAPAEMFNLQAIHEPIILDKTNDEINNNNYSNLYFELRELLETKQLYLNPEINLDDLIKLLGTNKRYLYHAIKSNYEDNFRSLLNEYRINHVKSMIVESIKNNRKIRMEEIQESSGFQSTASFFRVFKSKTGLTPLEYADQVKLNQLSVA